MQDRVNQRQTQKESTRKSLIDTAHGLFAARGIALTATADIAKKVRVSHGTVFTHFATREDLITSVVDAFGAKLAEAFESVFSEGMELDEILEAHLNVLSEFEDFYFRLITEIPQLPASVRSQVFMLNSNISYRMHQATEPLMKKGKLRKIDRHLLFNTWISLVQYYVMNRELLGSKKSILGEKKSELIQHFLKLVQP